MATVGCAALSGTSLFTRRARAFGEAPQGEEGLLLGADVRAESVLELFLFGGLSQYESFAAVPEFGRDDGTQWHAFLEGGDVEAAAERCGLSDEPLLMPFAEDGSGRVIEFGPFASPLRRRGDVLDRTRLVLTMHDALPHEVAVPLALTGRGPGNPGLAGVGAHIQRYHQAGAQAPAFQSYVLFSPNRIQTEMSRPALATGLHPGTARPLGIQIDAASNLASLLRRETVGDFRDSFDALLEVETQRFERQLAWSGGGALRSARFESSKASAAAVRNVDAVTEVLDQSFFERVSGESCGVRTDIDATAMNLRLAAHLLAGSTSPARHVCVIDGGFKTPGTTAGGYDSHDLTCPIQSQNLTSTLAALMSVINEPGESDPSKIDLDRTLVVIHTEFGRTPHVEGDRGRGHWPYAFPTLMIGGPVQRRGVYGELAPDARAVSASTPTANRAAILVAMGIWPFAAESFNVADIAGVATEAEAVEHLTRELLGHG